MQGTRARQGVAFYEGSNWKLALWLAGVLLFSQVAVAQSTGTILGVVQDSTGAVIPGANLTARNVETGLTRTTVSGGNGSYRFVALPVGSYEVQTTTPGFQTEVHSGLTLTVGQEAVVNFTLQVGAVEQRIEVTAEAPLINTTSGSLGGLVNEERVADLPLNGRNYIDLTMLQTGVVQGKNSGTTALAEGSWFSSNGAPLHSNQISLDGASMLTFVGGTSASINGNALGVEGMREFRVVTNAFSAEYGISMGSQTIIASKGGTNEFHGSLFEYLRNDALDARNFFDYKTIASNRRLPAFKRNQYGASFGGPIKKDKTFFHAVYEEVRERLGLTPITLTIPTAARVDGGLVPKIAPIIKPWLALFPEPNLPGNRLTFPSTWPRREEFGQIRWDQNFSSNDTLFVRYTIDDSSQVKPLEFPGIDEPGSGRYMWATLAEDHIFSPTLLNTFRFSFSRANNTFDAAIGIRGPQFSMVAGEDIGGINIAGITPWGAESFIPVTHKQNIFAWSDDVFYTRGRHSLKFGTLINRFQTFSFNAVLFRGSMSFANLTAFLLGQPLNYLTAAGKQRDRYYNYTTLGFYVQDDFRMNSRFTLNLGLRYEFNTEYNEITGKGGAIRDVAHDANLTLGPSWKNPSRKNISPRFGFAWDVRGDGKTAVRGGFGLLYDIGNMGGTTLGAVPNAPPFAGSNLVLFPGSFTLPLQIPPGSAGRSAGIVDYNLQQAHLLQYNVTMERQLPFDLGLTLAYAGSRGLNLLNNTDANPRIPQFLPDGRKSWVVNAPRVNPNWADVSMTTAASNSWHNSFQFGLLKRLAHGIQFQSSYTWSKTLDENQGRGWYSGTENIINADVFDRKANRGPATFDVAHTWRFNTIYRLPGLASSGGAADKLLNGWWMSGILSLNTGYPFSPVINANRSRSGVGGSATTTDRPDLAPGRTPEDIVSGVTPGCLGVTAGQKLGGPNLYYDPCGFTLQPAGFLGNLGRGFLQGPGFASLDLSLAKDTALGFLGERGKLEFRAEFFNILNRANFATPRRAGGAGVIGGNIASILYAGQAAVEQPLPTAAKITSTIGTSRQIQLALKILF